MKQNFFDWLNLWEFQTESLTEKETVEENIERINYVIDVVDYLKGLIESRELENKNVDYSKNKNWKLLKNSQDKLYKVLRDYKNLNTVKNRRTRENIKYINEINELRNLHFKNKK